MPYLRLPDNSYMEVPEGVTTEQALARAREKYPEVFEGPATPKSGTVAAAKAGFQELKGDVAALAGRAGLMDIEKAAKYKAERKREAERIFKPTEEDWLDAPLTKFGELAGGSAPYMLAPAVAGGAALLGGVPALGVAGAAGLASATQFAGSNLSRQMQEGKKLEETDLGAALTAAPFQAALDVTAGRLIPGIGKIFGAAGKKITPDVAKKIAEQGLGKAALDYGVKTGTVATAEGLTEAGQQLLERLQAGLDIQSPEARDEYFQSFLGGAVLGGTLGVPGRYFERRGIIAEGEKLKREEADKQAAKELADKEEQEKVKQAQEQEEQFRQQQAETGQLFGETVGEVSPLKSKAEIYPTGKVYTEGPEDILGKPILAARQAVPNTLTVREREYSKIADLEAQARAATDPVEKRRLEIEAARLKEQPSQRAQFLKQADTFDTQLAAIEKQRDAAAEAGDFKKFKELDVQAKALDKALTDIKAQLKKLPEELTPEMEMAKLRGEQKNLLKQLQELTGPSYDAKKANKITAKLDEIEANINEVSPAASQMDLFDEAKIGAEQRVAVQQQKEQRAQEQEDFFAQTKEREVIDENAMKRYQEGLQELEDAYAAGADERIVNQLIEKLQQIAQERDYSLAKSQSTPTGEEMEVAVEKEQRVKRAIKEEENKLYDAKTNEEVATIRANVDVLKRRLASMRTERAIPQPENIERQAKTDQTEAVRDAVEATRAILSGDYFNSFNVDAASSLKSGLETDIQDAGALYTKAAIAEINSTRQKNKQTQLTTDEGLRLATAIRSRFDFLAKDPTYLAEKVREKNQKVFEDSLERIKYTFRKGKPTVQRATPVLKQERDVLGMLRAEKAKKEPDQKRIAQLKKEIAARKAEEEKIEAEKTKQEEVDIERYAPSGISPDQKDLFSEKDLEPIAIVRATPANFMKFVNIQKQKFETAKKIAEDAIKKPMQKVKVLFGEKYAKEFDALENIRLQLENENKKIAPELYTPSKTDIKRYSKAFITARIEKAKNIREKHFANIKNLEDRQKEILEKLRGTETTAVVETLASKVAAQRQFVFDVIKADEFASNLKENATQLWQARGKIVKALENATKKERAIYEKALAKLDEQAPQIKNAIDSLHARANELLNANLKTEKVILKELEKKLADSQKGTPASIKFKKEADEARARIGKAEAEKERNLKRQAKEKRDLEEKQAAALKALPSTRQEIIETTARLPGEKEVIKQKRVVKRETPKTAAEKRAEMIAEEKEAAKERQAIREQVKRGLTPQQMETEVKKFKAAAAESRKKGNEKQAKRQEDAANALEKQLKSKMAQARMAMTGAKDTKTAQPPKMKTGVAKESTAKKKKTDIEQEARDAGVSFEDYEFVQRGLEFGFKARVEEVATGTPLSQSAVQKLLDNIKMPKGLKVVVLDKLPESILQTLDKYGVNPAGTRGWVDSSGTVYIVAGNHTSINDAKETIAHELIGHIGVEGVLGNEGMKALVKKISGQKGYEGQTSYKGAYTGFFGIEKLAGELGVAEDATAAYLSAKKAGKTEEEAKEAAVKEMIAHVAEATATKSFLAKANDFIKAMIGVLRAQLRKMGLELDTNTSDIYKIIRDARKQFDSITPGAYVRGDGEITFRSNVKYNSAFDDVKDDISKVVHREKSLRDKVKGSAFGLIFRTRYIDRFAPIERLTAKMKDALEATQLMYYLRMHDQRLNWTAEIASNGPIDIVEKKRADGQIERVIESKEGPNLKQIAEILARANVGSPQAANELFTFYLAALRAKNKGIEKLNFGKDVTPELLAKVMKRIDASPSTKQAFEKAREVYNNYNDGLINFAVKTGAISKKDAASMLKERDYIPFYRADDKGAIVLDIGVAAPIKIGNLKDQPYLHELVGGDTAIKDMFTSALQNTNLLTDMALRNLATRNVAFSLEKLGFLTPISDKNKASIRNGPGPARADVIRFKIDGEDKHAIVEGFDNVPAELIVKGMEGVKTSLPNLVEYMAMPASTLRKFITRNPVYALRQVVRDSLSASMASGSDAVPIMGSLKELGKMVRGKSEGEFLLQRKGILGGQVLTGTSEDTKQIMLQITSGKPGWNTAMAKLDKLAIRGDAASRVSMYNSFLKQGLSDMEATLATLESMNFSKRGTSPSMFVLNMIVPFMNAQVQGLDVIYKAFAGKMPFNEKLKVKEKLIKRAIMMGGFTLAYTALMYDDEAYKNANPDEKYSNWFMYVPGIDEPVRVPIPFELGLLFKALPEALVTTAFGDEKLKDSSKAIANMVWNSIPISLPAAIKPMIEVSLNKSFFTGREIETKRMQELEASERFTDRTSEIAKVLGKGTGVFGLSPIKLEYLIRGYTGSFPLAVVSLSNPVLRTSEAGDTPTTRASEVPVIGGLFQPKDASGLINKAYHDMDAVIAAKQTYNKKIEEGRIEDAEDYLNEQADLIGMATMAGRFRQRMGDITKQERAVRTDPKLSAGEKRQLLDELRQAKIQTAKDFSSARE